MLLALGASGTRELPNASGDDAGPLPRSVPLARLGPGRTLGNTGELLTPSNVRACAGDSGAVLLVWRREASVTTELSRMPLLLPSCWQAMSPLAVVAHVPKLVSLLRPLSLPQLQALPSAWQSMHASLTVVLSGEFSMCGEVEVQHEAGTITVGGWVVYKAAARIAVLAKAARSELDRLLLQKISAPDIDITGSPIISAIVQLLVAPY